jgi:acyl transferase domain-containing protein
MSCIYPAAPNVGKFWSNILSKVDAVSDPPEGWGHEKLFDPNSQGVNDRIYCKRGGFIQEFAEFNPLEFGIMPNAVDGSDPAQFLALRLAKEALSDAGYVDRPFNRERTGVILGLGVNMNRGHATVLAQGMVVDEVVGILKTLHPETPEAELQAIKQELKEGLPPFTADTCPGVISNLTTGLIANRLDLQGPNFTVDAACASSLIALDIGMSKLLSHQCDMAIVGGIQVPTAAPAFIVFSLLGALSKRGEIRPFDKNADGTLLGEGIGMMVIKRSEDAERDGDRIYALVKGVGMASDGRGQAFLAPRLEGESLALERAYEASGISPETIGLLEAHGTATRVGDATEIQAMTRLFGPRKGTFPRCALGTVKSMISHTIPASGMAGLIKTALALYYKTLPPTLCDEPNPDLELDKTPFSLNTETRPWIHAQAQPRRAAISAFGFGGINTHAILEEYTGRRNDGKPRSLLHQWDTEVIICQGESRDDLIKTGEHLLRFLSVNPDVNLNDIAYTLNCPLRESALSRLSIVAGSTKELEEKTGYALKRLADPECQSIKDRSGIFFFSQPLAREGRLAFLFSGEGSQYVNMLSDLCINLPEAIRQFDLADRVFANNGKEPLPSQVLFPPPLASPEERAAAEQTLWTMEYAVIAVFIADGIFNALLERLEIKPDTMVGHSSGHDVALWNAGVFVEQNGERVLEHWSETCSFHETIEEQVPMAKLMAVGGSKPSRVAAIASESGGELHVTMDNCPNQVILCGSEKAIQDAHERLSKEGAICTFLPFDRAYHTPWYQPVCDRITQSFEKVHMQPPRVEVYSCATARPYPDVPDQIRKMMVQQWAQPVRFRETIQAMYDAGVRIFVEVGPNGNLTSFVGDTLGDRSYVAVPANLPNRSATSQINYMLGLLAAHGVSMKLDYLYAHRKPQRLPIREGTGRGVEEAEVIAKKKKSMPSLMKLDVTSPPKLVLKKRERRVSAGRGVSSRSPGEADAKTKLKVEDTALASMPAIGSTTGQMELPPDLTRQSRLSSQVMEEYLQTMEQFLGLQQEIMEAFFKKSIEKKKAPGSDPEPGNKTR